MAGGSHCSCLFMCRNGSNGIVFKPIRVSKKQNRIHGENSETKIFRGIYKRMEYLKDLSVKRNNDRKLTGETFKLIVDVIGMKSLKEIDKWMDRRKKAINKTGEKDELLRGAVSSLHFCIADMFCLKIMFNDGRLLLAAS